MSVAIAGYNWYLTDSFQSIVGNTIKQFIGAEITIFYVCNAVKLFNVSKLKQ